MSPQAFLSQAAELDVAIQRQDRLVLLATVHHSQFLARAIAHRNELVREWARVWRTRPVEEE